MLIFGFLIVLSSCEKDEPNPVVTIPDSNFLSALIDLGVDANRDGIISPEEAEVIISLDVQSDSISDMTGIEAFINLESLVCSGNQLTSLDVSYNTALGLMLLSDMPSLNQVCVWETPFPPDGVDVDTTNSSNVYFTTDCTGGD